MHVRATRPWIGALLNYSRAAVLGSVAVILCFPTQSQNQFTDADIERILSEARIQANRIKDESNRLFVLASLAATEARLGNIQFALSEAGRLEQLTKVHEQFGLCDGIYLQVSRAQMRAGDIEGAIRTAQRMRDKVSTLYYVAEELAKERMIDRAVTLISQMEKPLFPRDKPKIFLELAVITAKNGDSGRANELFGRAESLSADLLRQAGAKPGVVDLSLDIAVSRQLCGDREAAKRMFLESRQVILGVKDESLQQLFLFELAAAAAKAGYFDLARQVFDQINDPGRKSQAGGSIVYAYLETGVYDTDSSLAIVSTFSDVEDRLEALIDIASMQVRKGDKVAARKTIEACQDLLKNASDYQKAWRTISLARLAYEMGDQGQGAQLSALAISLSDHLMTTPDHVRSEALHAIMTLQEEFGGDAGALQTARIDQETSFLEDLAEIEAHHGKTDLALRWVRKLKDPEQRARSLLGVVSGVLETQEDSREPKSVANPLCK